MPTDSNQSTEELENYEALRFQKFAGRNLWLYFLANPSKLTVSELRSWEKRIVNILNQLNDPPQLLLDDLNDIEDLWTLLENPHNYGIAQLAYNDLLDRLEKARTTNLGGDENFWQAYLADELAEGDEIHQKIALYQDNLDLYKNILQEIYHYNLTVSDRESAVVIPENHWIYNDMRDFAIIIDDLERQENQSQFRTADEQNFEVTPDEYEEELDRFIAHISPSQQQERADLISELNASYQALFDRTPNGVWAAYSQSSLLKAGERGREALKQKMQDLEENYLPLINKVKKFNQSVGSEHMIGLEELHPKFLQAINDFTKIQDDLYRLEQHAALPDSFWKMPDPNEKLPAFIELPPAMESTRDYILSLLDELRQFEFPPPTPKDAEGKMQLLADVTYQLDHYKELEMHVLKFNEPLAPNIKIDLAKDHSWFYDEFKKLKILQTDLYRELYSSSKNSEPPEDESPQKKF